MRREKVKGMLELVKKKQNSYKNIKEGRLPLVQYGPGDWVLMSIEGTPKVRNKLRPRWQGPYLVKDIISNNVYCIKDPIGTEIECHGCRLWPYEGSDYMPIEALNQIFYGTFKEYEVSKLIKLYFDEKDKH